MPQRITYVPAAIAVTFALMSHAGPVLSTGAFGALANDDLDDAPALIRALDAAAERDTIIPYSVTAVRTRSWNHGVPSPQIRNSHDSVPDCVGDYGDASRGARCSGRQPTLAYICGWEMSRPCHQQTLEPSQSSYSRSAIHFCAKCPLSIED